MHRFFAFLMLMLVAPQNLCGGDRQCAFVDRA